MFALNVNKSGPIVVQDPQFKMRLRSISVYSYTFHIFAFEDHSYFWTP